MTTFKGHKTGFNPGGSNKATPNESGPPKTKFCGRPAFGKFAHYPGGAADISDGNRRLAKSKMGDGGGGGTAFRSRTAFGGKRK